MGWISTRFMRNRAKWGRTVDEEKRRAPLRRIVHVVRTRDGMFGHDVVDLECGHRVFAYGDVKARCVECLRAEEGAPSSLPSGQEDG